MHNKTLISVAVELPLKRTFTYKVPETLLEQVAVGKRVLVPFGKRVITGFCVGFIEKTEVKSLKDVLDILDDEPIFDEKRLKFFQWLSSYYFAPLGEALSLACPSWTNIKSQRYFFPTEELFDYQEKLSPLSQALFELILAKKGISLAHLLKTFKGKSIYNAINRLKQEKLIREEVKIKGKIGERIETFASLASECNYETFKRKAPIQAKIIAYLSEKGETSLKSLRNELGAIDSALKKLQQRGLIALIQRKAPRNPLEDILPQKLSHKLTYEQEKALSAISHGLKSNAFSPFLLYGVTGSGKTLVYLKAMEEAVDLGKKAILLVPEISLTLWPVKYLTAMFPGRVAILHSGLSDGERYDEWNRIKDGAVDIVVGARSALFAPVKDLGLIIIDEEHEPSYKQEEGVRYNARDVSLMLGKMFNLTVVLGSATPSVETFYNAQNNKITPLHLTKRVQDRPMPEVELVDMRKESQKSKVKSQTEYNKIISEKLQNLMLKNHELGYQTILFLNRRGFSNFLICNGCGYTFQCLNCNVSLTMHKGAGVLKCHYCDLSISITEACPKCEGHQIEPVGIGTEQLEAEVRRILHKARIGRMDKDTTRKKRAHQKIVDAVDKGHVDVLVGTQMVAKGHHFPNVTLVGIVMADTSINIPDFRSSERTFQLITQAAGRAGREAFPGKVIIQTLNPDNFCLKLAIMQDYETFFKEELNNRMELSYPPFSRLINLRFEGNKEEAVKVFANKIKRFADRTLESSFKKDITILGPASAFLSKLRGKYRWHMLIKGNNIKSLHEFAEKILCESDKTIHSINLVIDVDPLTTL